MNSKPTDMKPIRIFIAEPGEYSEEALAIYRRLGNVVLGDAVHPKLPLLRGVDVLVLRLRYQIDQEWLHQSRGLRVIATPTTGLDHIDLQAAQSMGIKVISLKGEVDFLRTIQATSEHTWALLMSLLRHIPAAVSSVNGGDWNRNLFRGNELFGKNLGLLGLGRVGEKVARYAAAFGMRVAAYDPYRIDWVDGVVRADSMRELLRDSEILCVHVPLNEETTGMLGDDELSLLPRGAILVNTARGEVIDESALLKVLRNGHLAGAAVDVITGERQLQFDENELLAYSRQHQNLLITPHIAGATVESMAQTEVFIARKVSEFVSSTGISQEVETIERFEK
jgi:D-3-phosphoglycerate dehydrogenase